MGSEYMDSLLGNSCVNVMCKGLTDCVYFVGSTKPLYKYYIYIHKVSRYLYLSDHFQ